MPKLRGAGRRNKPYIPGMGRRGAGLGFAIVLIVAAIVLVLAARSWLAVEPQAKAIMRGGRGAKISDHGQKEAATAIRKGELPNLDDMKRETDRHAKEVKDAQKATGD